MLYRVEIGFGGYIGCSNVYEVFADSVEEAKELALEEASDDLKIEAIEEGEDDV